MNSTVFETLCERLGYSPDDVLSVRVNANQVVVVVRCEPGLMRVVNYEQHQGSLWVMTEGMPIGRGTHAPASKDAC